MTFQTPIKLNIPYGTYTLLQNDAYERGYVKDGNPNLNGFLNHLLPALSDNLADLYAELLEYYDGDIRLAKEALRGIYHVYLRRSTFQRDGWSNISLRVNKPSYGDFLTIHDERLELLDTDFNGCIRMLLAEYASKSNSTRDELVAYRMLVDIKKAIDYETKEVFSIYCDGVHAVLVPIVIESSPISDMSYLAGITEDQRLMVLRVRDLIKVNGIGRKMDVTEEKCNLLIDYLEEKFDEESKECLE